LDKKTNEKLDEDGIVREKNQRKIEQWSVDDFDNVFRVVQAVEPSKGDIDKVQDDKSSVPTRKSSSKGKTVVNPEVTSDWGRSDFLRFYPKLLRAYKKRAGEIWESMTSTKSLLLNDDKKVCQLLKKKESKDLEVETEVFQNLLPVKRSDGASDGGS